MPREGRNLCDLRRIFVGSLSERRSQKLRTQFLRSELACANSDSPSESSLANSGSIRSDGRKNPSAYYALVRSFSVGRIICVPHGANYALGIRDREFRLSASQSASRRLRTPFCKRGFEDLRVVGPLSPRRGVEVAYPPFGEGRAAPASLTGKR